MTHLYTMTAYRETEDDEEQSVRITFTVAPDSGDGWNTPHDGPMPEFRTALVRVGNHHELADQETMEWAQEWFDAHGDKALEAAAEEDAEARDQRAEMRRDDL